MGNRKRENPNNQESLIRFAQASGSLLDAKIHTDARGETARYHTAACVVRTLLRASVAERSVPTTADSQEGGPDFCPLGAAAHACAGELILVCWIARVAGCGLHRRKRKFKHPLSVATSAHRPPSYCKTPLSPTRYAKGAGHEPHAEHRDHPCDLQFFHQNTLVSSQFCRRVTLSERDSATVASPCARARRDAEFAIESTDGSACLELQWQLGAGDYLPLVTLAMVSLGTLSNMISHLRV